MVTKFKIFNNFKINEEINNEESKYHIGDIVELKGIVPGSRGVYVDNKLGKIINIIYMYNTFFYDIRFLDSDDKFIMREGNILKVINIEDLEIIKRKEEELRLKYKEIDPFGEEKWEY